MMVRGKTLYDFSFTKTLPTFSCFHSIISNQAQNNDDNRMGRQNEPQQRFHEHFVIVGEKFGVQTACLVDCSFMITTLKGRLPKSHLSHGQLLQNIYCTTWRRWQVKWRIIHSGPLKATPALKYPVLITQTDTREVARSRSCQNPLKRRQRFPFVPPRSCICGSPLVSTPNG